MAEKTKFIIDTLSLGVHRKPRGDPDTRIAMLPQDCPVTLIGSPDDDWCEVETTLDGERLQGFVRSRFLVPADERSADKATHVTEVHLRRDHPYATRAADGYRPFPIAEHGAPERDLDDRRPEAITRIIEWLDVESSARYQPNGHTTYCNIYAYDVCYFAKTYLPRVWWTGPALDDLRQGRPVEVRYGETVREMPANDLFWWLSDFGPKFGWRRVLSPDTVQDAVNRGEVGVICACHRDGNRSGHITAAVPETGRHTARRAEDGSVVSPLQSEAGSDVNLYMTSAYWNNAGTFQDFGFWVHP